jgi:phage terminase small subunit
MKRGRKPKPTALKILEGEKPCRINVDEPAFPAGSVVAPAWLEGLALEHWHELAPMLAEQRVLTVADRPCLALMCCEYRRWREDPREDKAKDRYIRLSLEFGLTPSSRSRIKAPPEKPKDDLAEFLGKKA